MPLSDSEKALVREVFAKRKAYFAAKGRPAAGGYAETIGPVGADTATRRRGDPANGTEAGGLYANPIDGIIAADDGNEIDRIIAEKQAQRRSASADPLRGKGTEIQKKRNAMILANPGLYKEISGMFDKGEPPEIVDAVVKSRAQRDSASADPLRGKGTEAQRGGAGGAYTEAGMLETGGRGLMAGLSGLGESAGTMLQYVGGKTGIKTLEETGKQTNEYFRAIGEDYRTPYNLEGSIVDNPALLAKGTWWAYNVANMLPSFGAAILPGAGVAKTLKVLGSAVEFSSPVILRLARLAPSLAAGAAGGALEGTNTYQEVLAKGGTKDEAESAMELMTLASGALNALSFGRMFKAAPAGFKQALQKYLATGVWEAATEWGEEPAEGLIKKSIGFSTWGDVWKQMKDGVNVMPGAFVLGAAGGAAGGQRGKADAGTGGRGDVEGKTDEKRAILNEIVDIEKGVRSRQAEDREIPGQKEAAMQEMEKDEAARREMEKRAALREEAELRGKEEAESRQNQGQRRQRLLEGMTEGEQESAYIDPGEQVLALQGLGYPDDVIVKMSGEERRARAIGQEAYSVKVAKSSRQGGSKEGTAGKEPATEGDEVIYRGVGGTSDTEGEYWTNDIEFARQFTQSGQDKEILSAAISKKDIFEPTEEVFAGDVAAIDELIKIAKDKGFKAIRVSEGADQPKSVYVIDKSAIITETAKRGEKENQYLTMPIDEVRKRAEAGSKKAQAALEVREAEIVKAREVRRADRLRRGLEKKGLIKTSGPATAGAESLRPGGSASRKSGKEKTGSRGIGMAAGEPVAKNKKSSDIKSMTAKSGAGSTPSGKIPEKPEGGKELRQEIEERVKIFSDSRINDKYDEKILTVGYRYGDAPESGYSYNTRENRNELGVSMASAAGLKESRSFATMDAASKRPKKYYIGEVVGFGGDNEPIMTNVRLLSKKEYEDYLNSQEGKKSALILATDKLRTAEALKNRGYAGFEKEIEEQKDIIDKLYESFDPRAAKDAVQEVPRSTSAKKAMSSGMPLEGAKWNEPLSPEAEIPETINKSTILKFVEKAFGVPIRGRVTYRWKSPGMYYPQDWIIRMKKWGELPVLSHEVAHHMDIAMFGKKYGTGWKRAFAGDQAERRAIRKELADLDYDQNKRRTSEGFAEFIRHYLTTGEAQDKAPKFYDLFVDTILPENKGLGDILDKLGDMMRVWQLQGAENRVLAQVDFKGEHTFASTWQEKKAKLWRWFQTKWNDEFYPVQQVVRDVERITGKELPPSKNPAKLLEFGKSKAGMIARTFVMEKAINEKGEPMGPGLVEILKPVGNKKMNQFIAYAVARRAQILHKREIESGIDIDDAEYVVKKYQSDVFDKALDGVTEWSDQLLQWVVRAGGLSDEVAALMRELNPIYIPFKRAFQDELRAFGRQEMTNKGKPAGSIDEGREKRDVGASLVDKGKPVKELKGSGMAIVNPIESLISQATELISKAQKVRIASSIADLAEQEGVAGIIDEVPAPIGSASGRMDRKQMLGFLKEVGAEIHPNDPAMDQIFTVFFQDTKYKGKDNVVAIWRKGERKFYELHHELYRALAGMDMEQVPPYLKLIAGFSRMLRLGATGLNISFGLIRNPFRDAQSYVVLSKQKHPHLWDVPVGLYRDRKSKEGDLIWRFKSLGGSIASMVGYDRAATMNVYDEVLKEMIGGKKGKVLWVARHPVRGFHGFINTIRTLVSGFWEMAPRSAELEGRYEELKKEHPEWTEEDRFIEAFNDAQDVTVNFTKSGQYAKQVNQFAAFFNVGIRGPEKTIRTFRQRKAHTFLQIVKYITLPAVALYLWNRKKQWYKNLPPVYKYNNMFIELGDEIIRLPIPFDIGLAGSASVLAGLDYLETQDPDYVEGLAKLFAAQIPNPTPSALGPIIDVWRNKNWLGQPIESQAMEGLPVTERTRDYTTGLAKIMSRGANAIGIKVSPVQLDYLGNQYTGGMSRILPRSSIKELSDVPVLADVLVRMPENPKRQMDKFFYEWERLSQREKAEIASDDELDRYEELKPVYGDLTQEHFKKLRDYRKKDDREGMKKEYEKITKLLKEVRIE